jgi:hypothetical protein
MSFPFLCHYFLTPNRINKVVDLRKLKLVFYFRRESIMPEFNQHLAIYTFSLLSKSNFMLKMNRLKH